MFFRTLRNGALARFLLAFIFYRQDYAGCLPPALAVRDWLTKSNPNTGPKSDKRRPTRGPLFGEGDLSRSFGDHMVPTRVLLGIAGYQYASSLIS